MRPDRGHAPHLVPELFALAQRDSLLPGKKREMKPKLLVGNEIR